MAKTIKITYTKPEDVEINLAKYGIAPSFVLSPSYVDAKGKDGEDNVIDLFPDLKNPEGGLGINFDAEKFYQINTMHPGVLLAFKRAYVDSLDPEKEGVGTCTLNDVDDLDALYYLELAGDANAPLQQFGFVAEEVTE